MPAPELIIDEQGELVGYSDPLDNDERAAELAKLIIQAVSTNSDLDTARAHILTALLGPGISTGEALSVAIGALIRLAAVLTRDPGE